RYHALSDSQPVQEGTSNPPGCIEQQLPALRSESEYQRAPEQQSPDGGRHEHGLHRWCASVSGGAAGNGCEVTVTKGILLGLALAPLLVAQTAPPKPAPAEKEEPDYAFLVNSPYVEEKGEVQVIGAIRFDTRRGNPDQKFSNAFARTEWGLTD